MDARPPARGRGFRMAKFPLSDSEKAQQVSLKKRYDAGDGMALLEAFEMGVLNYGLMPTWALSELLAEIKQYRRGAIRSFGDGLKLPENAMHKAHWAALVPVGAAGAWLMLPLRDYVLQHVPAKPSMVEMWKPLAEAIADNFRGIGWPPPSRLSARTLQRIWKDSLAKK